MSETTGSTDSGDTTASAAVVESGTAQQIETTVHVTGMSCAHCVAAVTEQLSALGGVTAVDVVLAKGGVSTATVHSERPLPASAVAAAIDEAGYALAP